MRKLLSIFATAFLVASLSPGDANGDFILDLASPNLANTAPATTSGEINGAIFAFESAGSGTGNFVAFLRIQANGTETGFNTDGPVEFDSKSGIFTRALSIFDAAVVVVDNVKYFRFDLDVNESGNSPDLTLEELKIYESPTNLVSSADFGVLKYDLDAGMNNSVLLTSAFSSGSGKSDYSVLIPVWGGAGIPGTFITLYSTFSGTSGGFEEWAVNPNLPGRITAIPEPSGLMLFAAALVFGHARRRK